FAAAYEATCAKSCFTTHTPVPAGNDVFAADLVSKYLQSLSSELGLDWNTFIDLGQDQSITDTDQYCMTVVALKTADHCNAVSKLHSQVSRAMWKTIWPDLPPEEVP